jgi:hypothetical protein
MPDKYAVFIITGHGGYNTDEERNLIEYESETPITVGSFAAPTETCSYPADEMINLYII